MEEEFEPIFDFKPLKEFLERNGYAVKDAADYTEFEPEEVTEDDIEKGTIEFTDEGIFVTLGNGKKQQAFVYKKYYHLREFGKPRFHICRCKTLDDFISRGIFNDQYRKTNQDRVKVVNLDNNNCNEEISELPLCRNCLAKIRTYGNVNSTQFVEILKQLYGNIEQDLVQTDIFGYTRDWEFISRAYREAHDYTCEECGLRIDSPFDRQYMHVHHIDADKTNNKEDNLRCLCLRCHSQVDAIHTKNLTTGANRILYEAFNAAYPKRRKWLINDTQLDI